MSVADRLNKLSTDITNAYTSINNKGGTIPSDKNTDNLHTAIDSIEVIEQATAEGESLSLTNTKAMPYSDYVVKGKSEQTTRSGKNLLQNTATSQTISGVTFTVNEDGSVTCNGTATNNIFFSLTGNNSIENIIINGCPAGGSGDSYLLRAIDTNGKVLKTDVGEGTGVFDLINARIQIRIAKDYICNNLTFYPMIRLATIEDDTYEPYGASPSPEYPSEIHSVADDVNLFEINEAIAKTNVTISENGIFTNTNQINSITKVRCQLFQDNTYIEEVPQIDISLGKKEISFTKNSSFNKIAFGIKSSPLDVLVGYDVSNFENGQVYTISLNIETLTSTSVSFNNVKIQKGSVATPYSPYNQGTVTIKQRGKNLFDKDNANIVNAYFKSDGEISYGGGSSLDINYYEIEPNTDYTISGTKIENLCFYDKNKNFLERVINLNTSITTINKNAYYFRFQTITNDLNLNTLQIEKGSTATPYEPYQANDYTIQTSPLRSLRNGVKDTIEEDGIHRRVGKIVLNGTETWEEAGTQYTGLYSAFIYIDDMKKQEGYNGDLLSNYFKENDFSTQEEGITKSSNPTSFALILIRLSNDNATNMTTFKNWLSNNPTELLYELATEVIEPLTQNQATTMLDIIKTGSYEGTTNIYTDEDVKPTIKVDYYKKK